MVNNNNEQYSIGNEALRVITQKGKELVKQVQKSIIRDIQKIGGDAMLLSQDSGLKNVWDEYCVQLQSEQGYGFNLLEDLVFNTCHLKLEELQKKDKQDFEILVFYLEDNRYGKVDDEYIGLPFPEIVQEMFQEIGAIASNYSNIRINKYIYS